MRASLKVTLSIKKKRKIPDARICKSEAIVIVDIISLLAVYPPLEGRQARDTSNGISFGSNHYIALTGRREPFGILPQGDAIGLMIYMAFSQLYTATP